MTRLTIELPDDVARDLEAQAAEAGRTPAEYAAGHLAASLAQQHHDIARFHELIREGDESGEPIPVDDDYFEQLRKRLHERVKVPAERKAKAS